MQSGNAEGSGNSEARLSGCTGMRRGGTLGSSCTSALGNMAILKMEMCIGVPLSPGTFPMLLVFTETIQSFQKIFPPLLMAFKNILYISTRLWALSLEGFHHDYISLHVQSNAIAPQTFRMTHGMLTP